jgi:hypothetical protein
MIILKIKKKTATNKRIATTYSSYDALDNVLRT